MKSMLLYVVTINVRKINKNIQKKLSASHILRFSSYHNKEMISNKSSKLTFTETCMQLILSTLIDQFAFTQTESK